MLALQALRATDPITSDRCSFCNCRSCNAQKDKSKCIVYNTSIALPRGSVAKAVVELSREYAKKNPGKPNVKSFRLKLATAKAKADKDDQAPAAGAVTTVPSFLQMISLNSTLVISEASGCNSALPTRKILMGQCLQLDPVVTRQRKGKRSLSLKTLLIWRMN